MNILIAPDSLKGSLSATEFCCIVAAQIQKFNPDVHIYRMPLADGGEGTIDAILANTSGQRISRIVSDPFGREVEAQYALLDESQTAVIEMAQASGLPLLSSAEINPMRASSYGTGELIKAALEQGCKKLIIGLGGSATNDGGTGMLQALGVQFFNARDQKMNMCGQSLIDIERIDLSGFDPGIRQCEITIAGDVTNPLLGEHGATYTFGPQKGADSQMVIELEKGMAHFAQKTNIRLSEIPGSGAAGGMGFSLMAYCQAMMKSGFELIAELADLDGIINSPQNRPDLIITGEGLFDNQSLQGKLIGRLIKRADNYHIPMLIICGQIGNDLDVDKLSKNISTFSLCSGPMSRDYAMKNSERLLEKLMSNLVKLVIDP